MMSKNITPRMSSIELRPLYESSGLVFKMDEIWKPVVGYPRYEVSNLGNVRGIDFMRTGRTQILFSKHNKGGYIVVSLCKEGKRKDALVHILVAQAFIPNPENKPEVDHINCIRDDNRVENLRWVTRSENCRNPITYAKHLKNAKTRNIGRKTSEETKAILRELNLGEKNHFYGKTHTEETRRAIREYRKSETNLRKVCKPVTQLTLGGERVQDWICAKYAEISLGLNNGQVNQCLVNPKRHQTAGGFKWEYAKDPERVFDEYFKKSEDSSPKLF